MKRITHNLSKHPLYRTWETMKQRCYNPEKSNYANYGGRGITICDRWLDFKNFFDDMGARPKGMQIDRIDNDKGYSPENCRWATPRENIINRRSTNWVNYKGVMMCLMDASRASGLCRKTIRRRLKKGLDPFA